MDRHKAYQLLVSVLDGYRDRTAEELEALVSRSHTERTVLDGEEYLVHVEVEWRSRPQRSFRVCASADSPGTFRLERVEEQLILRPGSG